MMQQIHEFMNLTSDVRLRDCGTQEYEADVVMLEQRGKTVEYDFTFPVFKRHRKKTTCSLKSILFIDSSIKCVSFGSGVRENNRLLAQCALHLRQYNDALLINDTLRMMDAYRSLKEFYEEKETAAFDGTDFFLVGLFQGGNPELCLFWFPASIQISMFNIVLLFLLHRKSSGAEKVCNRSSL